MKNRALSLRFFSDGGEEAEKGAEKAETDTVPEEKSTEKEERTDPVTNEDAPAAEKETGKEGSESDAARHDRLLQTARQEAFSQAKSRLLAQWEKEGEELKQIYPFYSPEEAAKNESFAALLKAGVPLRTAFEAANLEKIMGAAMKYAADSAVQKAALSLRENAARVQENSVLDRAASVTRKDVNSLTEKDILKILSDVNRGAVVRF